MSGYVIKRTDQGGGYVAKAGNRSSYTFKLERMAIFHTREVAERHLCPGNEVVVEFDSIVPRPNDGK